MAGRRVQFRRGSTAQHATFTGADGEITVDIDKKVLVVHDGATPGGFPMAPDHGDEDWGLMSTTPTTAEDYGSLL